MTGGHDKRVARYHHVLRQPATATPQGQTTHVTVTSLNENSFRIVFLHPSTHTLPAANSSSRKTSAPVCVLKAGALKALRAADCLVCVTSHLLATARSEAPAVKRTTYCKKISIPGRRSRFSEVTFPWFGSGRTGRIPSNRRNLDIDSVDKLDLESVSQPTRFFLSFCVLL